MITIDGRSGGGQVLRTALTLSVISGTPFEIEDVRGTRPSPGLQPQHLAAVRTMAELCGADVEGDDLGSEGVTFEPGPLAPASTTVDLRTAGSVTLLFDAVLPVAGRIDEPFALTARGGTDVAWSPTIGFLDRVKLPLLGGFGFDLSLDVERTGYYPAGGGEATIELRPSSPSPIELDQRGDREGVEIFSKAADGLADAEVADRQARRAKERLDEEGVVAEVREVGYATTRSPGSSLLLRAGYERSVAGFDELGERGKPAEAVADDAVDAYLAFDDGPGAVDEHLADQLLVPLAVAGGTVRSPRVTDHLASNVAVIERFGVELTRTDHGDGSVSIASDPERSLEAS